MKNFLYFSVLLLAFAMVSCKVTDTPEPEYTVVVLSADNTMGTVSGGGIYKENTEIQLTAVPNEGYKFVEWSDSAKVVSTDNPFVVKVKEDITYTASFELMKEDEFTITAVSADASMGVVKGGGTFTKNTEIQLTAVPNDGYKFSQWSIVEEGGNPTTSNVNPISLTVIANATYTASFEPAADGMVYTPLAVTDEIFNNPERGFHRFIDFKSSSPEQLTLDRIKGYYDSGYTLVLNNYYLTDYRDCDIPDSYLDIVRHNLQTIREGGCKCVLRFAYTSSEKQIPNDAPEELVLRHIQQIKPILQENADVIYVMEAGFVGVWGEWYYTTNFKSNPVKASDYEGRRHVLDALLDALPQERMICVRTPLFKMKCFGWTMADTLTRAEAYNGTPKARIACHDDAIMADKADLGTFTTTEQREYWEAETRYTVYGGESCPPGDMADCDHTIDQFEKMHISYLNKDYYSGTHRKWKDGGCFETFQRLIGYRIEGITVATTENPKAGEDLKVRLSVINIGYSAPKNPRGLEMILVNADNPAEKYVVEPEGDPRFWFTDEKHIVEAVFKPEHSGQYKVYLNLPDPQPRLYGDPRYSIRLANENCWDETTGYNYLTTVTVQ